MTTTIQGIKQNPDLNLDDLRKMAAKISELIVLANRGYSEKKSKIITASATADDTATVILASCTTNIVFTLPSVASVKDRYYHIIKTDSSTFSLTVMTSTVAEKFNGSSAQVTTTQYGVFRPYSNGSTFWYGI